MYRQPPSQLGKTRSNVLLDPSSVNLFQSSVPEDFLEMVTARVKILESDSHWAKIFFDGRQQDPKRVQIGLDTILSGLPKTYKALNRLVESDLKARYPEHSLHVPAMVLVSFPAGETQSPHMDSGAEELGALSPLSLILGVSEGGKLRIQMGRKRFETIQIPSGNMLIFHGNAIHSGCGYNELNIRIHWYAQHPLKCLKEPGRNTWIVSDDQPFQCSSCPRSFDSNRGLQTHLRSHSNK